MKDPATRGPHSHLDAEQLDADLRPSAFPILPSTAPWTGGKIAPLFPQAALSVRAAHADRAMGYFQCRRAWLAVPTGASAWSSSASVGSQMSTNRRTNISGVVSEGPTPTNCSAREGKHIGDTGPLCGRCLVGDAWMNQIRSQPYCVLGFVSRVKRWLLFTGQGLRRTGSYLPVIDRLSCPFLLLCSRFELAQGGHGGRGRVFTVAVLRTSFGLAGVMRLRHVVSWWIGGLARLPVCIQKNKRWRSHVSLLP